MWLWLALSAVAAVAIVRALRLPIWWVFVPPLAEAVVAANPHVVVLALLLSGLASLAALAVVLKACAIVPILGEGR